MVSENTKRLLQTGTLAAILIFIMVLVSETIGLGRTGFDSKEILTQFFFYAGPGIGFLFGVILLFALEIAIKEKDSQYGDSVLFADTGKFPAAPLTFLKSQWQVLILSIIVFSLFGLFVAVTQTTFTGVGQLKQQFTTLDNILYSSTLIPAAENLGGAFLAAMIIFLVRKWARRSNLSKEAFVAILYFLIPLGMGVYGLFNHLLRYSSSDTALTTVFIFWAVGGLLTVMSGSFIPFWIAHVSNNLFIGIQSSFSNDGIIAGVVITEIFLIAFYYFVFVYKGAKKKK